ncbi:MAG: MurT ligase domain-containing protein, partial [Coriobacteriales bacterium]|nr:MurT ligase domain-containing protein [Coriobacteriales bacterium]
MANPLVIGFGKLIQAAARLKGGGTAFPGLVVERIAPDFAVDILRKLPRGVVVISGTNGKTTTTKIVSELLEAQGIRVFTNSTGSNFMRGVIASLLPRITLSGRLDADIAVLELDEAHAVHFVRRIAPKNALLLNVMRDQLDRFGEIDHTADLLAIIARHTTGTVVINREDSRLACLAWLTDDTAPAKRVWYGLAPGLKAQFPQDDDLYADEFESWDPECMDGVINKEREKEPPPPPGSSGGVVAQESGGDSTAPSVILQTLDGSRATFVIDGATYENSLKLKGIYNAYNAAAALALVRSILLDADAVANARLDDAQLVEQLSQIESAFGRGETFEVNGIETELFLVKNPGGFRLALESFDAADHDTMIAINDEYADGRDMSWLYDVNFGTLKQTGVA